MPWTRFVDMFSGGGCKEPPYEFIYIEANQEKAVALFNAHFGHDPYRVTCDCCGEDYSARSDNSLAQLSAYDRGCDHDGKKWLEKPRDMAHARYKTLADYKQNKNVLILSKKELS